MSSEEQKSVEYILIKVFVIAIVSILLIYFLGVFLFVWTLSLPSVGPYGTNEDEYKRTTNVYYLQKSDVFVEETVIDDFAPMILQVSHQYPESPLSEKTSGMLLVDLPSEGGLAHPLYTGELTEDITAFFQKKHWGDLLSFIVFVQTPDSTFTTSWFSSGFSVANLMEKREDYLTPEDVACLQNRYPDAEIVVYPETLGGLYCLGTDGKWEISHPISSKSDFVKGTFLNRLKKKYFPKILRKSQPEFTSNGKEEYFGYSTN